MESCDEDDGGGGGTPSPQPWIVKGSLVMYKETAPLTEVLESIVKSESVYSSVSTIDESYASRSTTAGSDGTFSINNYLRIADIQLGGPYQPLTYDVVDIMQGAHNVDLETFDYPRRWDAFTTICKNRTDCHTSTSPRTPRSTTVDLGNEGGYLDVFWHIIGAPTNLKTQCNATGTQATLSWSGGTGLDYYAVRAVKNGTTFTCNASSNGPASICRNVTSNATTMDVTPYSSYSWWLNPEGWVNAYASSAFTCEPAPSAAVYIPESTCEAQPGKYPTGTQISFRGDPFSRVAGLDSSDIFIARECGNSLCSYASVPTWCSAAGGTMAAGNNSFCLIKNQDYSGETGTQTFYANWTPTQIGVYYAVINARSVNQDLFLCTGNPLCAASDSPLVKLGATACTDIRFAPCQEGKMGEPANPTNGELWGESIRFEVVLPTSCELPSPICGEVRSSSDAALGAQAIQIISGPTTRNITTASTTTLIPPIQKGSFSNLEFYPGAGYSVTLKGTPPAGEYPPAITSYTSQILGGANDCAATCGCDFKYRSCTDPNAIGAITLGANPIVFTPSAGAYASVPITWTQPSALKATSFSVSLTANGYTITKPTVTTTSIPSGTPSGIDTTFTYSIPSSDLKTLHDKIYADASFDAATDNITITVTGTRLADAVYCASYPVSTQATQTRDSTEQVKIRVKQSAEINTCAPAGLTDVSDLPGSIWASTPANATLLTKPASYSSTYEKTVSVPTGSTISANYEFNSNYFECNSSASCNTVSRDYSNDPIKICKTSSRADTNGNVTLYVYQWDIPSWWEVNGGLVQANETLESKLPVDSNVPILCPSVGSNIYDSRCAPFLARSTTFGLNLLAGIPVAKSFSTTPLGWMSEHKQVAILNPSAKNVAIDFISSLKLGGSVYEYFKNLVESKTSIDPSLTDISTNKPLPVNPGFYTLGTASSGYTLARTDLLSVLSGKSYVFFVPGNLTIQGGSLTQITSVAPGGYLAFFVKGTITIDENVGTSVYTPSMPTAANGIGLPTPPTANLTGIFVADGLITVESNAAIPDKRFIGEGSFVSMTGFNLPRQYSRPTASYSNYLSGFTPTELFRHRPDLVLSTPPELKEYSILYQEIN